jgi:hypothetical protein
MILMKRELKYITFLLFLFSCVLTSQTRFNLSNSKSNKIRFQLVNNIIVFPVELNGVKLSFVLDTGVSRLILFNLVNLDSLQIKNVEKIYLQGLGSEGTIQAVKSKGNFLKIGNAISVNQDVSIVFDNSINFTPRLGIPVHGIIGYDIFKDFIVEINYSSKYIRLHRHDSFQINSLKKWKTLPINIKRNKPYLNALVNNKSKTIDVKLLIDTGGSDALWLFENSSLGINHKDDVFFEDFLGKGLSGAVYGKRSKISSFELGSYILNNVNVSYPDSSSLSIARNYKERNGSISGNLLKRFNIFFDYKNKNIRIKKNKNFKSPFYYNNSGIVLEQRGVRVVKKAINQSAQNYGQKNQDGVKTINLSFRQELVLRPAFLVVELRPKSNAVISGVKLGDLILAINGKKTSEMTLQEVNSFFYNKEGKTIRLKVERNNTIFSFAFQLDNVFKKKSLQNEDSLTN